MTYGKSALLALLCLAAGPVQAQSLTGRVVDIEWPPIGASAPPADALPPAKVLEEADKSYLPVLVPRFMLRLKSLMLVADDFAYTASAQLNDASVSITGSRIAFGNIAPPDASDADAVSVDERSVDLTRVINGASYTLRIECVYSQKQRPAKKRCADGSYLQQRAQTLDLIGGNRGAPPPRPASADEMPPMPAAAPDTSFASPSGKLNPANSGKGVVSPTIYAPGIRFPLRVRPAYLNSQVYGYGGASGPAGDGWGDTKNYKYPWYDNFCEARSRPTSLCPSGKGHQGVDIRPADDRPLRYEAVAVEAGKIHRIGTYSVSLLGNSGTEYRYLHMGMADVRRRLRLGKSVSKGEVIGLVSSDFGGTQTTVHLHFEIWKNMYGRGSQPVPPYASLVQAYAVLP